MRACEESSSGAPCVLVRTYFAGADSEESLQTDSIEIDFLDKEVGGDRNS